MLDDKTYSIIKILEDYFLVGDMSISPAKYEYDIYQIYFELAKPCFSFIKAGDLGSIYGYKVLASTAKLGLPLIDKSLFTVASSVGVEPVSVIVNHMLREDYSYPIRKENGYVKIINVNY